MSAVGATCWTLKKHCQPRPSVSSMTISNEDKLNRIATFENAASRIDVALDISCAQEHLSNWLGVIIRVRGKA